MPTVTENVIGERGTVLMNGKGDRNGIKKEPVVRFELTAGRLRSDYSTPELHRLTSYNKHLINSLVALVT